MTSASLCANSTPFPKKTARGRARDIYVFTQRNVTDAASLTSRWMQPRLALERAFKRLRLVQLKPVAKSQQVGTRWWLLELTSKQPVLLTRPLASLKSKKPVPNSLTRNSRCSALPSTENTCFRTMCTLSASFTKSRSAPNLTKMAARPLHAVLAAIAPASLRGHEKGRRQGLQRRPDGGGERSLRHLGLVGPGWHLELRRVLFESAETNTACGTPELVLAASLRGPKLVFQISTKLEFRVSGAHWGNPSS